ncbi:MAG: AI-2E family transporter [Acidobacteria bacterium]|nr:AI-2E family transporter [Acidobacteriota bacterium]
MAQPLANLGNRWRGEAEPPNLPPPQVTVARSHAKHRDWALDAVGLLAVGALCYYAEQVLVVILASVLIAFVLAPVADLFMHLRLPRWVASFLALLLLMSVVGGVSYYGINQAANLVDQLPRYTVKMREKITKVLRNTQKLEGLNPEEARAAGKAHENAPNLTELLTRGFGSATEALFAGSFIPFLVFFMLNWQEHARAATVGLFPLEDRHAAHLTIGMIATMVRTFIVGNFLIALLIGAISSVIFAVLGIPFFLFAGFASGFLSLVPYLGVILALLPPLFVGVGNLGLNLMVWVAVTVLTLHIVSLNVLYPKFLGGRLRLNPLAVTIALLAWASLWGAVGLIMAIPITAGIKIVFDHVEALKPLGAWLGESCNANGTRSRGED